VLFLCMLMHACVHVGTHADTGLLKISFEVLTAVAKD